MQLPFAVIVEPPSLAELQRVVGTRWRWAVAVGIIASGLSGLAVSRPEMQRGTEAVGTVLLVNSSPSAAVEVDGRARGQTLVGMPLVPGEHRVTLHQDEYANAAYVINAGPGQAVSIAAHLWLRSPRVRRLRPTHPGANIVATDFLRDDRLALTAAQPPGDERQLWIAYGSGGARRDRPPEERTRLVVAPRAERGASLAHTQGSAVGEPPVEAGSAFAAGSEPARAQMVVADRGSVSPETSQIEYWLVRFRPEAGR